MRDEARARDGSHNSAVRSSRWVEGALAVLLRRQRHSPLQATVHRAFDHLGLVVIHSLIKLLRRQCSTDFTCSRVPCRLMSSQLLCLCWQTKVPNYHHLRCSFFEGDVAL